MNFILTAAIFASCIISKLTSHNVSTNDASTERIFLSQNKPVELLKLKRIRRAEFLPNEIIQISRGFFRFKVFVQSSSQVDLNRLIRL